MSYLKCFGKIMCHFPSKKENHIFGQKKCIFLNNTGSIIFQYNFLGENHLFRTLGIEKKSFWCNIEPINLEQACLFVRHSYCHFCCCCCCSFLHVLYLVFFVFVSFFVFVFLYSFLALINRMDPSVLFIYYLCFLLFPGPTHI